MAKTQTVQLYQVECAPECGFLIRDHDQTEIVPILITHCVNTHSNALSAEEARKLIKRL